MIAVCGSCGKPVRVATTTSCAKLKLDPEPVEEGGEIVIGKIAGVEVAVRPTEDFLRAYHAEGMPVYRTHVGTCSGTVRQVSVPAPAPAARPHPFGRRNRGGNPREETGPSEQR